MVIDEFDDRSHIWINGKRISPNLEYKINIPQNYLVGTYLTP